MAAVVLAVAVLAMGTVTASGHGSSVSDRPLRAHAFPSAHWPLHATSTEAVFSSTLYTSAAPFEARVDRDEEASQLHLEQRRLQGGSAVLHVSPAGLHGAWCMEHGALHVSFGTGSDGLLPLPLCCQVWTAQRVGSLHPPLATVFAML